MGAFTGVPYFTVPQGVQIIFYGVHGNVLSDPGIKLIDYDAKPVQIIPNDEDGSQCFNYALSKDQGSHGGTEGKPAETYDFIKRRVDYVDDTQFTKFNALLTTKNQQYADRLLGAISGNGP